jgi:hypothetical protein
VVSQKIQVERLGFFHLSVSSTSLPPRAAQMNDVALRANDVLRNDADLRPTMLRFAQTK